MNTNTMIMNDVQKNTETNQEILDNQKMIEAAARYKAAHTPVVREYKIGRNEKCPCGSGKKYKKCCLDSGKYEKYTYKK